MKKILKFVDKHFVDLVVCPLLLFLFYGAITWKDPVKEKIKSLEKQNAELKAEVSRLRTGRGK